MKAKGLVQNHTKADEKRSPPSPPIPQDQAPAAPALAELSEVGDPEGHLMWTQLWLWWLELVKQIGFCIHLLVDI